MQRTLQGLTAALKKTFKLSGDGEYAALSSETATPASKETAAPREETAAPCEEAASPREDVAAPREEASALRAETAALREETAKVSRGIIRSRERRGHAQSPGCLSGGVDNGQRGDVASGKGR